MAPEIRNKNDREINFDEKVDVFSFGIIFYFILNDGKIPNEVEIGDEKKYPEIFTQFSKDLIKKCIDVNPQNRLSFNEICLLLRHNFMDLISLNDQNNDDVKNAIANRVLLRMFRYHSLSTE